MFKLAEKPRGVLKDVLVTLVDMQQETCAIGLQIGSTCEDTNQVLHNYVVVTSAPPKVVSYLVNRDDILVDMRPDGLYITPWCR